MNVLPFEYSGMNKTEEHKKETISDQKPTKIVVTSHTNNTPHITLLLLCSIKKIIHKIAYKNKKKS